MKLDRFSIVFATGTFAILAIPLAAQPRGGAARLRVEYLDRPVGLDVAKPRFSWIVNDDRRGARQTAYQLQVAASSEQLQGGTTGLWDTKTVGSDRSVGIVYEGPPLESRKRYWWRVRLWDKDGKPTAYSEPTYWETGLLNRSEWLAKWVGIPDQSSAFRDKVDDVKWVWHAEPTPGDPPQADRWFRAEVEVKNKPIRAAHLLLAVDNSLTAFVNGQQVGQHGGWQGFARIPIHERLTPGKNVVGIVANNAGGPAALAAIVQVAYADGEVQRNLAGPGWVSSAREVTGWLTKDFVPGAQWTAVKLVANYGEGPWGRPGIAGVGGPASYLRKEFTVARQIKEARLYATALGSYRIHINGRRVGNDILTPEWTDYKKRAIYQTYDVTAHLKQGGNAIAAIVGDGWYASGLGWNLQRYNFGDPPVRLLAQMHVSYVDGTEDVIATDRSWHGAHGPILRSELYAGETYDATKELAGWDRPGGVRRMTDDGRRFSRQSAVGSRQRLRSTTHAALSGIRHPSTVIGQPSDSWEPVNEYPDPEIPLEGQHSPTIQVTHELKPLSVNSPAPGVYVFDLGQNMVGWARLKVKGPRGSTVRLRFAELLQPSGQVYVENLRAAEATDRYTLKGQGTETWEPHFTYHGFRYVEVTGYPGTPGADAITGRVFYSAMPTTLKLTTSSELVNKIQKIVLWGQMGNHHSVPTDCPQRDERLGWMGDATAFARTACYNMDMAAFYSKWLKDVADAQSREGGFSDVAPRVVDMADGAPAWGDAGIIVPYETYRAYGDTRVIERMWNPMEAWMNYIHSANPNYLWLNRRNNDFGDWVPAESETPKDLIATAFWAYDAKLMTIMARAIGRTEDSAKYAALFENIKNAFAKQFVKPDGVIGNGSQTCYVLALFFDLVPSNLRTAAVNHLVKDIERRNAHLSTGFLGTPYLLPVLSDNGRNDVAYRLLLNDDYPSWGYMIKNGATTVWERWNSDKEGPAMNSRNHYAFGSVGQWMYGYLAGIDTSPTSPGFKSIVIRPRPGNGVTSARAEYDSVHGKIVSDWAALPDGAFTLNVTIPANTAATVYIPVGEKSRVTESGKLPDSRQGIRFLQFDQGAAVYAVPAGSYKFVVSSDPT